MWVTIEKGKPRNFYQYGGTTVNEKIEQKIKEEVFVHIFKVK